MIPVCKQFDLLGLARPSYYYHSQMDNRYNLQLLNLIGEKFSKTPFYGVEDDGLATTPWRKSEPQAGTSINVPDGTGSHVSEARAKPFKIRLTRPAHTS
jgi:hypothetical protein